MTANHSLALTKIEPAHGVLRIETMMGGDAGLAIMTGGDATSLGGGLRG